MSATWNKGHWGQAAVLLLLGVVLYAANFDHEFHLDSGYGLQSNAAVRSLTNIPSYFTDPFTLTSLRSNADYRPVLQVTYALNYAWSGYDMWSWHLVQIALHTFNAVCLMLLVSTLLPRMLAQPSERQARWIPFVVALLFLVHPTASGVVNYLWARSSLLTASFLLPSFLLFVRGRSLWAAVLFAFALFTKVEAVGALGVYAMWLVLEEGETTRREAPDAPSSLFRDLGGLITGVHFKRLAPFLALTAIYATTRVTLLPEFLTDARSDADMTSLGYLSTQVTAWWHYIWHWFVPVGLVADNLVYPRFESLLDGPVILALLGWTVVAGVALWAYRIRPVYTFLAVSGLAVISPHSSFMPLAEMVNEHRPYLPLALLSLCWMVPCAAWFTREDGGGRRQVFGAALLGIIALGLSLLTIERNRVFSTWEAYWSDVVEKAPSWRAHLNLGWYQNGQGDLQSAKTNFLRSLEFAPYNFYALSNLGVVYGQLGEPEQALNYHGRAVEADELTSIALEARARYLMSQKRWSEAVDDLSEALRKTMLPLEVHLDLARSHAHLGRWRECGRSILAARAIDPAAAAGNVVNIVGPFWASTAAAEKGVQLFEFLAKAWPGQWWVHANLADLGRVLGQPAMTEAQQAIADELKGAK